MKKIMLMLMVMASTSVFGLSGVTVVPVDNLSGMDARLSGSAVVVSVSDLADGEVQVQLSVSDEDEAGKALLKAELDKLSGK